ncbi:hypothetical protein F5Y18DRAFT_442689 [Xylariaceae sp. FL1019]|nr:hypothetical protein F5Y18DRAFT_442689 [Xylariaceae sp. FL1019]
MIVQIYQQTAFPTLNDSTLTSSPTPGYSEDYLYRLPLYSASRLTLVLVPVTPGLPLQHGIPNHPIYDHPLTMVWGMRGDWDADLTPADWNMNRPPVGLYSRASQEVQYCRRFHPQDSDVLFSHQGWEEFHVSPLLLEAKPHLQTQALLLLLPVELLEEVYKYLDLFDLLCLALSCKTLLHHRSRLSPLSIPSVRLHMKYEEAQTVPGPRSTQVCGGVLDLLARVAPTNPDILYTPKTRLCIKCQKHRWTRPALWIEHLFRIRTPEVERMAAEIAKDWGDGRIEICPPCGVDAGIEEARRKCTES